MGRRQFAREPLSGWIQIVKGPRPPSEKWPKSPQIVQGSAPQQRRRQIVNAPQAAPRQIAPVVARTRTIDLLGEGDAEEKRVLQFSLQKAEQQAEALPLSRQIASTKEFIERAKKRIPVADEKIRMARVALQDALDEKEYDSRELPLAEARLERLLAESVPVSPAEVTPQDLGNQVTSLQQMVKHLEAERDAFAARVQKPEKRKMTESVHPVQGSTEAADLVFNRASKRRACGRKSRPPNRHCASGCAPNSSR